MHNNLPRLQIQAFYCFPVKKRLPSLWFLSVTRSYDATRRCNKKDADLLNAHQFADTSNSSFLHSFPTQKRLPDNLVYVRIPPPDVEPATNSVHRDRRSSKTSTGSNSKDASNPNSGSVSEGIYVIFFQTLDTFELFLKIWVYFQAYLNLYPLKKWVKMRKIWR